MESEVTLWNVPEKAQQCTVNAQSMMSCTVNAQSMTSCTVSRLCVSSFGRVERFPLLDQDINGNNYVRSPEFQSGVCLFKYSKMEMVYHHYFQLLSYYSKIDRKVISK